MPEYDNTNRGALFPNDKEGNESRPDFTGRVNVDGRDLRLAAWKQESKNGTKYLSLRVSEFQNGAGSSSSSSASTKSDDDFDF